VERWGSAAEAFDNASLRDREEALAAADGVLASMERGGVFALVQGEAGYPDDLLELPDPPPCVFGLGDRAVLDRPIVAIVGTRNSSQSGELTASRFATALARAGACVASGMARGIDAAAHRGALDAGGATVAVLGGGPDVPFPPRHRALHREIAAHGLVLSETLPGMPPPPGAFPRRNRIIAALARTVVVIEAGWESGALITSRKALELNRTIGAVPGRIDDPRCTGSNRLLRDGAVLLTSAADVLLLAGLAGKAGDAARAPESRSPSPTPDATSAAVLDALARGAVDAMEIARLAAVPTRELLGALATLEARGTIWTDHRGMIHLAT
jgi:DNA processing protein